MEAVIFDIKEFSLHDGPGARITVFFKGCPLHCLWCHNPEGLSPEPQLLIRQNLCVHGGKCRAGCNHPECRRFDRCIHACPLGCIRVSGKVCDTESLAGYLNANADFLTSNGGGVTFSGGEPMLCGAFLRELIPKLGGMHTAIQTSAYTAPENFRATVSLLDFVMMDLKLADREMHKKYTGVYNDIILENFRWLKQSGKKYVVRVPLIPEITDTDDNLKAISAMVGDSPVELLKYNVLAGAKYPMLGMKYPLAEHPPAETENKEIDLHLFENAKLG